MAANMIATRQKSLRLLLLSAAAASLVLAAMPGSESRAVAAPVIVNWRTGLAIYGFDPVAYFAEGAPLQGRADVELAFEGVTWRFRNDANRAAFAAHPEIYRPRFGGYDPLALVRGIATAGNPLLWLIHGGRLYFFHDPASRAAFAANPAGVVKASDAAWPRIEPTIVP
jgi:YHS domain-containing protein